MRKCRGLLLLLWGNRQRQEGCMCVCLPFLRLVKNLPALLGLESHSDKLCFSVNTHSGFSPYMAMHCQTVFVCVFVCWRWMIMLIINLHKWDLCLCVCAHACACGLHSALFIDSDNVPHHTEYRAMQKYSHPLTLHTISNVTTLKLYSVLRQSYFTVQ